MRQRAHHITFIGLSLSLDCGIASKLTITLWLTLSGKITSHFSWKDAVTVGLIRCSSLRLSLILPSSTQTMLISLSTFWMLFARLPLPYDEASVKKCIDTLYSNRFSNLVGICPQTAPSNNNNNNNRRLVTLAEHTSDHGRQTNSSTEEKGEQV